MPRLQCSSFVVRLVVVLLLLVPLTPCSPGAGSPATGTAPDYGDTFWSWWGDGKAELAGYDLTYPRYGEARRGTAVAIFVTETFASGPRVKSEDPQRAADETFPVIKLNLAQDFATGIYDYNLMTSAFVALQPVNGRPAGHTTKVSFSGQEWCGHVYAQALFDRRAVRLESHSYFDGEADRQWVVEDPGNGVAEDSLLLWARGLAGPRLAPGESTEVSLLRSLELARLRHRTVEWDGATLARSPETRRVTVPAGEFEVDELTVTVAATRGARVYPPGRGDAEAPGRTWTFWVERQPPHRVVRWSRDDGLVAELLAASRLQYWSMNGDGFRAAVEQLGLRPRSPRTP